MDSAVFLLARQHKAAEIVVQTGQDHVVRHRHGLYQPIALAIFRDQCHAQFDAVTHGASFDGLAGQPKFAGGALAHPGQTFKEFRTSGAHQAIDAQNFAVVEREGDMIDGVTATLARQGQILHAQQFCADGVRLTLKERGRIAPDHLFNNPRHINLGSRFFGHQPAVAQDGHIVANLEQLIKFMRDINDRNAIGF